MLRLPLAYLDRGQLTPGRSLARSADFQSAERGSKPRRATQAPEDEWRVTWFSARR